ncbi:hypothetical protein [Oscillibacter sp.]|uniref:hypothetical protein n=1 Tax=Oscillibacter sp. TaxID=1945593 RepID=UPI0026035212|nr:hypothetical protein [Oscillibacter sp.]MDD3347226.1 hypothetical protein [Oscillibacter sp.]
MKKANAGSLSNGALTQRTPPARRGNSIAFIESIDYIIGSICIAREKIYKERLTFGGNSEGSGRFAHESQKIGKLYKELTQSSLNMTIDLLRILKRHAIINSITKEGGNYMTEWTVLRAADVDDLIFHDDVWSYSER